MKVTDLYFDFPEKLIAQFPVRPSRVMLVDEVGGVEELSFKILLECFLPGDVLVINNTQVLKRRVFSGDLEILFLRQIDSFDWEVLFPSKKIKIGSILELPGGVVLTLIEKGRPQRVRLSCEVDETYFQKVAELPLPPYIQKARSDRHTILADENWYQTAWASCPGSFAAPTASLHFSLEDMDYLKKKGVHVCEITLHVGLGTFLPVTATDLDDHKMHEEFVEISSEVWTQIQVSKRAGSKIWALGTTTSRSLESAACGLLNGSCESGYCGFTKLLIQPGFEFKVVDRLLTNFHQPQSTLLALVAAFTSLDSVKSCYKWAIARDFRLFSYGDLTCWIKK